MTPLIDVVFLLIIFFLVSSHLSRRENHLPVDLPVAVSGQTDSPPTDRLVITLDETGRTLLRGDVVNQSQLADELNQHAATAKSAGSAGAVRIRCDDELPYATVSPVLRTIATSGCTDFVIAVKKTSSGETR